MGAYTRQRTYRNEIHHARNTASWNRHNRPICLLEEVGHDISELKYNVCDFIVEICKENGEEYPSSSFYDLLGGLSLYLQHEKNFNDKLMSATYKEIRNTLDNVMKERTHAGIKGCPECDVVTENHKQILWEKGILGESNPDQLRRTIFFLCSLRFGLRGGQEHSEL